MHPRVLENTATPCWNMQSRPLGKYSHAVLENAATPSWKMQPRPLGKYSHAILENAATRLGKYSHAVSKHIRQYSFYSFVVLKNQSSTFFELSYHYHDGLFRIHERIVAPWILNKPAVIIRFTL
jgi:hypothetical protein